MSRQHKVIYEFGDFRLDATERLLFYKDETVTLKPKVLDLLIVLINNNGHTLIKSQLIEEVWPDSFVEEGNLAVSIFALRRALSRDPDHNYIETIPRRGYRFSATVRESAAVDIYSQATTLADEEGDDEKPETLAVLPFKTIDPDPSYEYLGLGIADALITRLSNIRQVRVRPTSAVRNYIGQDPVAAGRELKVESVLDGSIQRWGEKIRVTVQLVSVPDGTAFWAEKFDENFTNLFAVEDSISERVVSALTLRISGEERRLLTKKHTYNNEAYQAYLKGRYFLNKRKIDSIWKAIKYFECALEKDSGYALAYAGLADCYRLLGTWNVISAKRAHLQAMHAAMRAVELENTLAEAHASLGFVLMSEWDWAGAEKELKRAIKLNPSCVIARRYHASFLRIMGRIDESLAEIEKARELDPLSMVLGASTGSTLYLGRRYEEAVEQLLNNIEMEPSYHLLHFLLGVNYIALQRYDEAIAAHQEAVRISSDPELVAHLAYAYGVSGRGTEAESLLDQLNELSKQQYISPYFLAKIYVGFSHKEQAFEWLEKSYLERDEEMCMLKMDPMVDPLRDDPRFTDLLRRVGFN